MKQLLERIKSFFLTNSVKRNVTFGVIGGIAVLTAAIVIPLSLRVCDHIWDNGITQTEAGCTENGVKVLRCRKCRDTKLETIEAKGHSPKIGTIQTLKEPTCKTEGERRYVCDRCGETVEESIPVTNRHDYEETVTLEPTCKSAGEKKQVCRVCGATETSVIPATNEHKYEEELTREPTCTEGGVKTLTCSVCGKKTEEKLLAKGHNYAPGETKEATCTEEGYTSEVCLGCGDTKKSPTPLKGHDYAKATCTSPEICSVCGATRGEALGHVSPDGVSCTRCGCLNVYFVLSDRTPIKIDTHGSVGEITDFCYETVNDNGTTVVRFMYTEVYTESKSGSCSYTISVENPDGTRGETISVINNDIRIGEKKRVVLTSSSALTVPGSYKVSIRSTDGKQ